MNDLNYNSEVKPFDHSDNSNNDVCIESIQTYEKKPERWSQYLKDNWSLHIKSDYIQHFINILKNAYPTKPISILDAGCGPGHSTDYFRLQGLHPIGVDISTAFYKLAKKIYGDIYFREDDIRTLLKCNNEEFIAYFASYSLIHIPKKQISTTLKSMNRVLINEGYFYISVYSYEDDSEYEGPIKHPEDEYPSFKHIFSRTNLQKDLENSGFTILGYSCRKHVSNEADNIKFFIWGKKIRNL